MICTYIDDVFLNYYKYGNGKETILILPGWGDTRDTFEYLINNLSKKYTIYIIDYPGFGKSSFPDRDLTIYDYVCLISKFVLNIGINNFNIICHSFGCRIASIISTYDININKIIIIGGAGIRRKSVKRFFYKFKYNFLKKLAIFHKSKNLYLNKLSNRYGSSDYNNLPVCMKKTFCNVVNEDLRKYIKNIKVPTLLIWGEDDLSTPLCDGILMNKLIKDSGLVIIKNGSHFVYLEYPFYILNIINFFLD